MIKSICLNTAVTSVKQQLCKKNYFLFFGSILLLGLIGCKQVLVRSNKDLIKDYFSNINSEEFEKAKILIEKIKDSTVRKHFNVHYNFSTGKKITPTLINFETLPPSLQSLSLLNLGNYFSISNKVYSKTSFEYYLESLDKAKIDNDTILLCEVYKKILYSLYKNSEAPLDIYNKYINQYKKFIYNDIEKTFYSFFLNEYLALKSHKSRTKYLKTLLRNSSHIKNNFIKGKICQLTGIYFSYFEKKLDSASKYYDLSEKFYQLTNNKVHKSELHGFYINRGILKKSNNEIDSAKYYFEKALRMELPEYRLLERVKVSNLLSEIYEELGVADSVIFYLKNRETYESSLNQQEKVMQMIDSDIRHESYEKNKLIASAELKNTRKNNQLIISLSLLVLVIISAYLLQKNTRKKQLLAEQAKNLEEQKVENLLKDQELASIDAMIEGQEKERKRIAEDLHDDLGALMATINLHLENIDSENNTNALSKTKILLAEAYSKIRNISHVNNAGVIANESLLVAVKNMTSMIKSSNQLDIEVIAQGLDNRIENSLELSIFRIIQELMTNVIKHSEATKATIQLIEFNNYLNIIVEDNGKGFEFSKVENQGIGLKNIKKRIEYLKGKLSIDSVIGKGATILIDIPIQ